MKQHRFAWLIGALLSAAIFVFLAGCKGGVGMAPSAPGGGNPVLSPSARGTIKNCGSGGSGSTGALTVDDSGNVGGPTSISVDLNTGRVRLSVSYYDQRHKSLWLASSSAFPPAFTLTPADTDPVGVGRFNSVLADPEGDLADVVFYYRDFGGVKRAHIFQHNQTDLEFLDATHDFGAGLQAILHKHLAGVKYEDVAYVGSTTSNPLTRRVKVRFAWLSDEKGASGFVKIRDIDDAPDNFGSFGFPSLGADPTSDNLGVAYKGQTGQLKFATGTEGGTWAVQDVLPGDPRTARVSQTSTVYGPDGTAHIIFNGCTSDGCTVYHAFEPSGAGWNVEPTVILGQVTKSRVAKGIVIQTPGAATSDADGNLWVVAYRTDTHNPVVLADVVVRGWDPKQKHWLPSNFRIAGADTGTGASIAIGDLDGDGFPDLAISFVDNTHHWLDAALCPADAPPVAEATGTLFAADTGNNRVQAMSTSSFTWTQVPGQFTAPSGIAHSSDGSLIFVSVQSVPGLVGPQVLRSTDGGNTWSVLAHDASQGAIGNLKGIAYDEPSDTLYVADPADDQMMDIGSASGPGPYAFRPFGLVSLPGNPFRAEGVAVDSQGDLFVADTGNSRILECDAPVGTVPCTIFAGASAGTVPGKVNGPRGIFVDDFGDVFVADSGNNRVQVNINGQPNGWRMAAGGGGGGGTLDVLSDPEGVVLSLDGDMYVSDTGHNRILRYPSSGAPPVLVGGPGAAVGQFSQPTGLR